MVQENKTALVQIEIERLIDSGRTNLQEIYTIVCDKYGVQRPAARRAKKQLLVKLKHRVEVLGVAGGRSSIQTGTPIEFSRLSTTEQSILKILKERDMEMKFSTLHLNLNSIVDGPLIKKDRLTYCLRRLTASLLVKLSGESRYKITQLGIENVK